MRIGCPRERKTDEFRVALTPDAVAALRADGHEVILERGAGLGAGLRDEAYEAAGARIGDEEAVWGAELVVKVKEPIPDEYARLRRETLLFCFLHLAAVPRLAQVLVDQRVTAVAFETVTDADGSLPLLTPMSMVAGRLSVQVGATAMQKNHGGRGLLLSGLPGVPRAHVVILGAGVVGRSAMQMAIGLGARVSVLDIQPAVLRDVDLHAGGRVESVFASAPNVARYVAMADLLIGAVLVPGARAPHLVSRETLRMMAPGSVAVDVAVDQGGCFETTRPTTHREPTYVEDEVIHYAVANMPSITARTSTLALVDAVLPWLRVLAADPEGALRSHAGLREGLTTWNGAVVHPRVAESLGMPAGERPR